MHPMFAELYLQPDEALEADEQRRARRARRVRRSRQLRTISVGRGRAASGPVRTGRRAP